MLKMIFKYSFKVSIIKLKNEEEKNRISLLDILFIYFRVVIIFFKLIIYWLLVF